jgi:hypothetical protein
MVSSSYQALMFYINSETLSEPLVSCFSWVLTCLTRPRDGLVYVLAKIFHASQEVVY